MRICISKGICDPLSRDKGLNPDNAFCFELILMPNFSTSHIGCGDCLLISIFRLYKYGYPSNNSCNKACDICKIKNMVIKLFPLGYVNNFDRNHYLERFSKAAVHLHRFKPLNTQSSYTYKNIYGMYK